MALPPIVGVEIGTTKTVALVGEWRDDNCVMITGMGEHPSAGIRKSSVIDLESASVCLRTALSMAEESAKVSIGDVHLAISGGHIQSQISRGTIPVMSRDRGISRSDMSQVMEVARSVNLPTNREVLHALCQNFIIDGQLHAINPEGMEGSQLSLDMVVVHGMRVYVDNLLNIAKSIPVQVHDVVFSGMASALAVLTTEQRKSGALVIDIGGGSTSFFAYADGTTATAGSVGLGGDHITNDISYAFSIPTSQAERLKCEHGSAVMDQSVASQRITLPPEGGFPGQTVGLRALHTVINARMDEIFGIVRKHLDTHRLLHHFGAGVVITGGGAALPGVTTLAENLFNLPCAVGTPRNISGLGMISEHSRYATCTGLVQYGFKAMMEERSSQGLRGLLGWLLRK